MSAMLLGILLCGATPDAGQSALASSAEAPCVMTPDVSATNSASTSISKAISTAASDAGAETAKNEPVFISRKPAELRAAVRAALQAESTIKEASGHQQAVRQLMLLLLELEQDQNLTHDERVALHTQIRSRLMAIESTLRTELARQNQNPIARQQKLPSVANTATPTPDQPTVLAQMALPGAAAAGRNAGLGRAGNGSQGPNADAGPELVDLIHTVVAPRTWDVNGGPGSVVYYRNLRALVIRAPAEIHEQVGDLLGQLRK